MVVLLMLLLDTTTMAANRFAVASGNWNGAIWAATVNGAAGSAGTPGSADVVTINTLVTVTVNVAAAVRNLTVNGTLLVTGTADVTFTNAGSVTVANGGFVHFGSSGQFRGGANNANGILVTINAGAHLKTANTLGFRTGTGNTTLTGSIAIRPGNRGAPQYNSGARYTYNGTTAQAMGNGISNADSLIISNTAGVTATNALTVVNLVTDPGTSLNMGTNSLSVTNVSHSGNLQTQNTSSNPITPGKTWGGTVLYTSASSQTIVNGNYNDLNSTGGNRTLSTTDTIGIAGVFTPGAGNYVVTPSIVDFNGNDDQDIPAFIFHVLMVSNAGIKKIAAGTVVTCQAIAIDEEASVEINADGGGKLDVLL